MEFFQKAKEWMTPERAAAFQGIGMGLSQLSAGQPVDLSPAYDALQQRQEAAKMRKVMEVPGLMDSFTPQQRAVLASMPESLATKIIMEQAFQPAPEPVKGVAVGGRLINPITGDEMYTPPPELDGKLSELTTRATAGGLKPGTPEWNHYILTGELPQVAEPPETRTMKLADGSEVMVQWDPAIEDWIPARIPEGGTGAQPRTKLTELEAKTALFGSIQTETSPVLNQIEEQWNPANLNDAAARSIPIAGNFFQSPQGQIYEATATAWAEGALRLATGAAAQDQEIKRVVDVYFARPGDTPATIAFKSQLRAMYQRAIERSLGRNPEGQLILPQDFVDLLSEGVANPDPQMSREDALRLLGGE